MDEPTRTSPKLTYALPKGRLLTQVLPLMGEAGIDIEPAVVAAGRRLMLELPNGDSALLVKPSDVPTYVEYGVADIGIAGYDTLAEREHDLYEPVNLGTGACRLVVAAPADQPVELRRGMQLRVATKYPRLTRMHYHKQGIAPEIIHLYGSVELGAITKLADQIVDLVESGETLRQNRLVEVETVMHVTSRLIVHPASLKLKTKRVTGVIEGLRDVVSSRHTKTASAT